MILRRIIFNIIFLLGLTASVNAQSATRDTLAIQSFVDLALPQLDSTAIEAKTSLMHCPKVFNYNHLGMFCKFDYQLDKSSSLQLRFRLGTLEAVDTKEGKGPTTTPIDP